MNKPFEKDPTEQDSVILATDIFDRIMPNVSPASLKVLLLICRKAYKNDDAMPVQLSLNYIREKTGIQSENTIRKAIKQLESDGHITLTDSGISPSEAEAVLRKKLPQRFAKGTLVCDWCGAETLRLQSHHYPIPSKDNGTCTVMICANCHYEYHILVDQRAYRLSEDIISIRG